MSNYDLERNVTLELRLQVVRAKLTRLRFEVEGFLGILSNKGLSAEDVAAAAKRLEDVNRELKNVAPNLQE